MLRAFRCDAAYGVRLLRANMGFAATSILILALGIASSSTIYTWIRVMCLSPFPGVRPGVNVLTIESVEPKGEGHNISYPDFRDYRDNLQLFDAVAVARTPNLVSLGDDDHAEQAWGEFVSGTFFDVFDMQPALGRFLLPAERGDTLGAAPVVVISHRLWRNRYANSRAILGSTLHVNRVPLTIVGVAPESFAGSMRGLEFDLWIPLSMGVQTGIASDSMFRERRSRPLNALARLKAGVSVERGNEELKALAGRLAEAYPKTNEKISAVLLSEEDSHAGVRGLMQGPLWILLAMCGVVLAIACVNVSNLLLARAAGRRKEMAMRLALGADTRRLAVQLLTEVLILSALAAVVAIPLMYWMRDLVYYLIPQMGFAISHAVRTDFAVFVFALGLCLCVTVIAGMAPAWHTARSADLNLALRDGGRGSGGSSPRANWLRSLFVVAEVALALVALVGAGLFVLSFRAGLSAPLGFDPDHVSVARIHVARDHYSAEQQIRFLDQLKDRLSQLPGIEMAAYADTIPLGFGLGPSVTATPEGYVAAAGENLSTDRSVVGTGYFSLLRIPLVEGRDFRNSDDAGSEPVVIVNQEYARRYLGTSSQVVGRRIKAWKDRWFTVIGVVRDSKYYLPHEPPRPYLFAALRQVNTDPTGMGFGFYVRSRNTGSPDQALAGLRREVNALDPHAVMFDAVALTSYIHAPLFPQRVAASLLSVLGAFSLLLAALGLYSVMAYSVSQRTAEIGLRVALGAMPGDVLKNMMGQGMRLTVVGVVIGLILARAAVTVIDSLPLEVSHAGLALYAGTATFLTLIAMAAIYVPARRASRIDPGIALRAE